VEESREPDIDMKIYPNPSSTMLNLELQHLNSPALVSIYDLQGRVMATNNIPPGTGTLQMDVSGLPAGIYLLVLSTGFQQAHRKIIIY
ncbi:MAG: T9SS type A sorting domain-containing protein, partial [Bacteroidetes bacterium]|nr:T9SS type A sorting domain-containing protein [Bacteroidota bacterium]